MHAALQLEKPASTVTAIMQPSLLAVLASPLSLLLGQYFLTVQRRSEVAFSSSGLRFPKASLIAGLEPLPLCPSGEISLQVQTSAER
jgi:hypothetical protein